MFGRSLLAVLFPVLLFLPAVTLLAACGSRDDASPAWQSVVPGDMSRSELAQQARAQEAKTALLHGMFTVIQRVLATEGEVPAVSACGDEAVSVAHQVADELGVEIGRTSFRLRNPKNAPPDWARAAVMAEGEGSEYFRQASGQLAALFPVRMQMACVTCHGARKDISPPLLARLERHYPEDQAFDFTYPGLRGYVWVEVPPIE